MKIFLTVLLFFVCRLSNAQCYELLDNRLKNIEDIPYSLVEKFVIDINSGKMVSIKVKNVEYKKKLGFIFQSKNLGDTLDVTLITLNRKVLAKKKITKIDDFLHYDPFRKSENYFLLIQTSTVLDTSNKKPLTGCLGLVVLERVKYKAFKKVQRIDWR